MKMNQRHYNIFILLVLVVGGIVVAIFSQVPPVEFSIDFERSERMYWEQNIDSIDPGDISDKFKERYQNIKPDAQHSMAHILGDILYKKDGLSTLALCDYNFGTGGCFHELISHAISENGVEILLPLDTECLKLGSDSGSCRHGIGHGVLFYLGYTYQNLLQSLELCNTTNNDLLSTSKEFIEGCVGGVFMEYNSNLSFDEDENQRMFNASKPNSLCELLDRKLKPACSFWQVQWWNINLTNTPVADTDRYETIGVFCDEVLDFQEKSWCFRGIGHITIPDSNWAPSEVIRLCSTIKTEEGRMFCQSYAGSTFLESSAHESKAELVCDSFEGDLLNRCITEVTTL